MMIIVIIISDKNIWMSRNKLLINLIEHICLTRAKARILIYVVIYDVQIHMKVAI